MDVNLPSDNPFRRVPDPRRFFAPVAALFILLASLNSTFFKVDPEEVGVIQRFGKYIRTESPGLHLKIPLGIETLRRVKTERIIKEEFGFQTLRPGIRTEYADRLTGSALRSRRVDDMRFQRQIGFPADSFLHESMMLTGDLNLAVVEWTVQYRYLDPYKALFKIRNLTETVRNMTEAVMRRVVGDRTVDEVITLSRSEIEEEVRSKLQDLLDRFDSGVKITQVVLQNVNPPDEVKPSFNDVNTAKQDKERAINQAWEEYNKFVPKARGDAERIIREAEGFALNRVNRAEGDAKKFISVWEEYKNAEDVTRRRMYLETLTEIFTHMPNKIVVDEELKGLLPLLDLSRKSAIRPEEGGQA